MEFLSYLVNFCVNDENFNQKTNVIGLFFTSIYFQLYWVVPVINCSSSLLIKQEQ